MNSELIDLHSKDVFDSILIDELSTTGTFLCLHGHGTRKMDRI